MPSTDERRAAIAALLLARIHVKPVVDGILLPFLLCNWGWANEGPFPYPLLDMSADTPRGQRGSTFHHEHITTTVDSETHSTVRVRYDLPRFTAAFQHHIVLRAQPLDPSIERWTLRLVTTSTVATPSSQELSLGIGSHQPCHYCDDAARSCVLLCNEVKLGLLTDGTIIDCSIDWRTQTYEWVLIPTGSDPTGSHSNGDEDGKGKRPRARRYTGRFDATDPSVRFYALVSGSECALTLISSPMC